MEKAQTAVKHRLWIHSALTTVLMFQPASDAESGDGERLHAVFSSKTRQNKQRRRPLLRRLRLYSV